jgi:hypothetical protein
MTEAFWDFNVSWRLLLPGLLLLTGVIWQFQRGLRQVHGRGWHRMLDLLRVAVAGLLVFTLLRPERVRVARSTAQPVVAILYDTSGSMETRDVVHTGAAVSRSEWVASQVAARFWAPLEERYRVELVPFDATEGALEAGTDIHQALDMVARRHGDLRTVLLISDGDWNQGYSPVRAATELAMRDVPVFGLAVGSAAYLADLELLPVTAPAYGLVDEHIVLPFTIQSRLPRDVKSTITLRGSQGYETSRDVLIPAMSRFQDSILFVPPEAGTYQLTLRLPVETDEMFSDNNQQSFAIDIRRELLNVLVIDTLPRWEYRFLRNALERDPGVAVTCLLLHPGMEPAEGRNYIRSFPATREDLSVYDVVFLGDVGLGHDGLSAENALMLRGLVEQQGSGLIFLPGGQGRQLGLLDSELGALFPVALDVARPQGYGVALESKLVLTPRGANHLLTMLAADQHMNQAVWRGLPGFFWYAAVERALPGGEVLAVHASARNRFGRLPMLVAAERGSGKVLFMATDSAWRWRRGVEDVYHYRFWGQVVRWMSHQRHLAHAEGIRFFHNPTAPVRGERVFMSATVFDGGGMPVTAGLVEVTLTSPSGGTERLVMQAAPGGWGVFTADFVPEEGGTFVASVVARAAGRRVASVMHVSSPSLERIGHPARPEVLREITSITSGQYGGVAELAEMVAAIGQLPDFKPVESRFRLWCHPAWAALLIGLLGCYWVGRKLAGMV